jgi:parallel beta-helix repeat protein
VAGNNVQAIYLDDQVSGFIITNNTFTNCTRAYHLGGGRSNVFAGNTVRNPLPNSMNTANHVDNRGMGWSEPACTPPSGILVEFLARVPYNTSAVWTAAFPELARIAGDEPCQAKYNLIAENLLCGLGALSPFDQSAAALASWDSVMRNNTVTPQCS